MAAPEFIGMVHSSLKKISDCPLQETENAPQAMLNIDEKYLPGLKGLKAGSKIVLLTWLHQADRDTLTTRPRNNPDAPLTGVFATRSPGRPNPVGIHTTEILSITGEGQLMVSNLEVVDGTPLIDIKPVIYGQLL